MPSNSLDQIQKNDYLTGRQLTLARLVWLLFALTLTFIQTAGQIAVFRQVRQPHLSPEMIERLAEMGVSEQFYGAFNFLLLLPIPLVWGGLALLIFAKKSNERGALVVSAMMVGLAMSSSIPVFEAFAAAYPGWAWLVPLAAFTGNVCLYSFFCVFPTGRYVPRWTVGLALSLSAFNILNAYGFALPASLIALGKSLEWAFPIFLIASLACFILAPIYRYRRVSILSEREQIRWVVFTIVAAALLFAATISTVFLLPNRVPGEDVSFVTVFVQPIGWVIPFLLIPIAIAIAILRYRLFDIDIVIRKTLQYSTVTALLALIYFGSVFLLQRLFSSVTGQQSPLVLVVSTLLIAALFAPLRRRVQDGIDRRFYRKKYDARQMGDCNRLAGFARVARDETDVDALLAELERTIQETLQPKDVRVWLRKE